MEDGESGCIFADPCAAGVHNCEIVDYCVNHIVGQFYCEVRMLSVCMYMCESECVSG